MAFDIAKGIAIILVVYAHCLRGLVAGQLIPDPTGHLVSDYVIYTFHMPVFFLLSGYFFRRPSAADLPAWWVRKSRTIVYPYFLWSIVHGTIAYAMANSGATNGDMPFSRIFEIAWNPISPFWFLYALFFSNVLAVLLLALRPGPMMGVAFVVFVQAFFLAPQVLQDISYGFFYFALGIYVREKNWMAHLPRSGLAVAVLTSAFLAVAIICLESGVPERMPIIAAMLGIAALLAICFYLERNFTRTVPVRALAVIGQCSMGIFVMHILVISACRFVFLRFLEVDHPGVILAVATVVGVLVPTAVQIVALRLRIQDYVGLPASAKLRWRQVPVPGT
jgi:fucose 4-O-acetylase-like acetyltransferase